MLVAHTIQDDSDDAAAIDDGNPVAELIGFHHVVGGEDHGPGWIFSHPAADLVAHITCGPDIQRHRRFVQE